MLCLWAESLLIFRYLVRLRPGDLGEVYFEGVFLLSFSSQFAAIHLAFVALLGESSVTSAFCAHFVVPYIRANGIQVDQPIFRTYNRFFSGETFQTAISVEESQKSAELTSGHLWFLKLLNV